MRYPQITINLRKIKENAETLLSKCQEVNIESVFLVTDSLAGDQRIINELKETGFSHLAASRIENLIALSAVNLPKVLLTLPMKSEVDLVVNYADISFNSEISVISKLNQEAKIQNKIHQIILLFDMGDLSGGIFFKDDYLPLVEAILEFSNIRLIGIATNFTSYGGIIPTKTNLTNLIKIKEKIEETFAIKLKILSGGSSSTLHLIDELPRGINNLRLGEALFFGRETAYQRRLPKMHQDCFIFSAGLIEVKTKPSYPIGIISRNCFGKKPNIRDRGIIRSGILALGKEDINFKNLRSMDKSITILGASDNYLFVCLKDDYQVGDLINFKINYQGLLELMSSSNIKKNYLN